MYQQPYEAMAPTMNGWFHGAPPRPAPHPGPWYQGCQTSAAQAQSTVSMRPQTNAAQALVGLAFQGGGGRPVSFHNAAERAATPSLPGSFKAGGDAFISKSSSVRATPDAQRPVRLPIAQRSSLPAPALQKMEHHDSSIGSKPANDLPVNDKARIEDTFDLVSIDNEDLLPLHTSYTSIKSVDDVASLTQSGSESLVERLTQKVNVASSASALHSPKDDCARPPPYLIGLQDHDRTSATEMPAPFLSPSAVPTFAERCNGLGGSPPMLKSLTTFTPRNAASPAKSDAETLRAYLGVTALFASSAPDRVRPAALCVEVDRITYLENLELGNVVRQAAKTRLTLLPSTYSRYKANDDSVCCWDEEILPGHLESPEPGKYNTRLILATVAGMTTSERVHNQLCSLALGHLYAALFSRDNDFGLSVEFVRKRAYSFGHVHPNNLVVAVDDPPRLSQNTFQNEAVDNARWFAFQCFAFVRSKGTVFFASKKQCEDSMLESAAWDNPVVLNKGKDESFDGAWKFWRLQVQSVYSSALNVTTEELWAMEIKQLLQKMHALDLFGACPTPPANATAKPKTSTSADLSSPQLPEAMDRKHSPQQRSLSVLLASPEKVDLLRRLQQQQEQQQDHLARLQAQDALVKRLTLHPAAARRRLLHRPWWEKEAREELERRKEENEKRMREIKIAQLVALREQSQTPNPARHTAPMTHQHEPTNEAAGHTHDGSRSLSASIGGMHRIEESIQKARSKMSGVDGLLQSLQDRQESFKARLAQKREKMQNAVTNLSASLPGTNGTHRRRSLASTCS